MKFEEIASKFAAFLLHTVVPAVLLYIVGLLTVRLIMKVLDKLLEKSKMEKVASGLIRTVVRTVLYGLLILMVASRLGIDVTGIVALASVLTLAVSLSVQNLLTNLISGLTLLYTRPFSSGDFVEIAGKSGTVQEIGLTYTRLATGDNKSVCLPNGAVTAAEIVNYTVLGTRRVDISVSASYDMPVEQVLEALREAGRIPTALAAPAPFAAVTGFGESAIAYTLQIWCRSEDYWTTLFEGNKNVRFVFYEKKVQMTFPHLNVHLDR